MRKFDPSVKITTEERVALYQKVRSGKGTTDELMYLSWVLGVNTKEQYEDYLQICKWCDEFDRREATS